MGGLGHLAGELFGDPGAVHPRSVQTGEMKKWLEREGMARAGGPPEEFLNRIRGDVAKWKKVVKEANIPMAK
jgi:tripartite-type tricarboxylate transporter receptor subunit TctC